MFGGSRAFTTVRDGRTEKVKDPFMGRHKKLKRDEGSGNSNFVTPAIKIPAIRKSGSDLRLLLHK